MNTKHYPVMITSIERHSLSFNGNPRFKIETTMGTFFTGVDASLGYSISNYTNTSFPDQYILNREGVVLHGDGTKSIWYISLDGTILQ